LESDLFTIADFENLDDSSGGMMKVGALKAPDMPIDVLANKMLAAKKDRIVASSAKSLPPGTIEIEVSNSKFAFNHVVLFSANGKFALIEVKSVSNKAGEGAMNSVLESLKIKPPTPTSESLHLRDQELQLFDSNVVVKLPEVFRPWQVQNAHEKRIFAARDWATERDECVLQIGLSPNPPDVAFRVQIAAIEGALTAEFNLNERVVFSKVNDSPEVYISHVYVPVPNESHRMVIVKVDAHRNATFVFHSQATDGVARDKFMRVVDEVAKSLRVDPDLVAAKPVAVRPPTPRTAPPAAPREPAPAEIETARLNAEAAQQRALEAQRLNARDLPAGSEKTVMVGGNGGGPYLRVDPDSKRVIGFRVSVGNWGGRATLGEAMPLYEAPEAVDSRDGSVVVVGKKDYVVGGVIVSGVDFARSMRVIFFKQTGDKIDTTDSYLSDWSSAPTDKSRTQLAGRGERVIGTWGLKGMNLNGLGLVVVHPDNTTLSDDLKNGKLGEIDAQFDDRTTPDEQLNRIEAGWIATKSKPVNLLPTMKSEAKREADGTVVLGQRQSLATQAGFRTPVTFRAVVWTSPENDLRIGYPVDQIIFNWEMNKAQLRVDGGALKLPHKDGVGSLPGEEWAGIEIAVTARELVMYVNGKEIYRQPGDFTKVNKPFTITSHRGEMKVKSISVVR